MGWLVSAAAGKPQAAVFEQLDHLISLHCVLLSHCNFCLSPPPPLRRTMSTKAVSNQIKKKSMARGHQRRSNYYRNIVENQHKDFIPLRKEEVWIGGMGDGAFVKVTQHTPVTYIPVYSGRGGCKYGCIVNPREETNNFQFVKQEYMRRFSPAWIGVNNNQCMIHNLTDFVDFKGEQERQILIEDTRGKKKWWKESQCRYVMFDGRVSMRMDIIDSSSLPVYKLGKGMDHLDLTDRLKKLRKVLE